MLNQRHVVLIEDDTDNLVLKIPEDIC